MPRSGNPVAPLYLHCGICPIEQRLLRCSSCRLIQYCSKEHQAAHWMEHKSACSRVKKRRNELRNEEQALRANPNDGSMHYGNPFVTGVGHFWGLFHTRDYMRARYSLIEATLEVNTFDAVEAALGHSMDMLRLSRSDNMGIRSQVPALFLRLGRDRACYDFLKWWATIGQDSHYDWGDTSLPYIDTKDADIYEPVDLFCRKYLDVSYTISVTLLKLRLFLDIRECLQNVAVLRESQLLPTELFDHIQDILLRSVLRERWDETRSAQYPQLVDVLSAQVDRLYEAVKRANKHFWPALLNPGRHLDAYPSAYSHGSVEEMQMVLKYSIDSWRETPGALELIAIKRKPNAPRPRP